MGQSLSSQFSFLHSSVFQSSADQVTDTAGVRPGITIDPQGFVEGFSDRHRKELRTTLLGEAPDAMASKEVAAAVAAAVKGRSTDPEAHRLFLQARYFIDRNTREDTRKGIGYLKEALLLEPEFALAWGSLAEPMQVKRIGAGPRRPRALRVHGRQ